MTLEPRTTLYERGASWEISLKLGEGVKQETSATTAKPNRIKRGRRIGAGARNFVCYEFLFTLDDY